MSGPVMILASLGDEHACAVHRALGMLGNDAHIYLPTEILGSGDVSVDYSDDRVTLRMGSFEGGLDDIGASWNRRLSQTFREPAFVHPADRDHLVYAAHSINRGLAALLDRRFPVNPLSASVITSNKLLQLDVARRCGLRVPRTVISSDPARVSAFLRSERIACVKPYTTYSWVTAEGVKASTTALIEDPCELDRASIALVPHIYQEYVRKTCEYRVTMFGRHVAATRIDSQSGTAGALDWRADAAYLSNLRTVRLPHAVEDALHRVMRALGLRFGAFDLAQDPDGEFVFFEVNEAGQWLWQEIHSEGCPLLEPFARFLSSGDDDFAFQPDSGVGLSAATILEEVRTDPAYARILPSDRFETASATEEEMLADCA